MSIGAAVAGGMITGNVVRAKQRAKEEQLALLKQQSPWLQPQELQQLIPPRSMKDEFLYTARLPLFSQPYSQI